MQHTSESQRALTPETIVTSDAAPRSYTNQRRWTSPSLDTRTFGVLLSALFVMWAALLYSEVASVLDDRHTNRPTYAAAVAGLATKSHPCENAVPTVPDRLKSSNRGCP